MPAKRRAKQYFGGRRAAVSKTELALTLAVIVGLSFVTLRVMTMGGAAPTPTATQQASVTH